MCHRLRSAEVLLGIISFSPAKGRGEATRLLMTVVFQRGCFPGGCAVFPQGFSPLETKPFPQWMWAAGPVEELWLWGAGHAPPLSWWAQAIPLSASWDTPRHSPVTRGAPWASYGSCSPQEPLLQGLCMQGEGDSLTVRFFLHKREPGAQSCPRISSVLCTKKGGKNLMDIILQKPRCSRWLASVFRFIHKVGRSKNFGACFCVRDALGLDAVNNGLCQT